MQETEPVGGQSAPAVPVVGPESDPVPLPEVEDELNRRLRELQGGAAGVVLRARMSNLVVYCDTLELGEEVDRIVPEVLALHPARVLLLVATPHESGSGLTATVKVCAHPIQGRQELCSEQVTLRAVGRSQRKLPFVVRGLLIGDLPTNLWWASRTPPPMEGELFYELSENTQQVVYDSIGWPEPARGVLAVAAWVRHVEQQHQPFLSRAAADLNWRRLKYWRRLLAQALSPAAAPGFLESVREVEVEHGPHGVVQAWLMASWLASRLNWRVQVGQVRPNVEMVWQCSGPHGVVALRLRRLEEGEPAVHRMKLTSSGYSLTFAADEGQRLAVSPGEAGRALRTVTVPPQPLAQLVGRELREREQDPVFRESLAIAQTLAQSVVG